ncbi:Lrp/AsnC family transcriptional regulator [Kineococcus aurantiacus]|uniref:Lrp/AsnC family leucine-responsive transcriptional regulator n=1 Tax=Kineococcus aurantiacus TaxID=37633 RepID=A0A7Y9J367_9ACTN|nr:Lrp/AsnC family transcriptional regulator [Kineococcus aurantiacus]NYD24996.1 Lrp/AsnC family leucine-responsive transcriptional regulator [Kineococcus aurantiacus]
MTSKIKTLTTGRSFDDLDVRILEALQVDARTSFSDLARRLSLSQPAVSQRVRKLEEAGVIRGYRAEVDPSALGIGIRATVRLRTTHAHLKAALQRFGELPEVLAIYRLTGEDCFLLHVAAIDAHRLEEVVDSIARFGPVTTALVLREYPTKPVGAQLLMGTR